MTANIAIVGAGMAGLIAGHAWPTAQIFERGAEPTQAHKALLRFRSDVVANLTGVEFKQVLVRKGIWARGGFTAPSIRLANQYAQKCIGVLAADRSIWNLDPSQRFIAPTDFHEQLMAGVRGRVAYGVNAFLADELPLARSLISTAPLPVVADALDVFPQGQEFLRAPIYVLRYDLGPKCDVYQTIYFPDPELSLYRASITGRMLIIEFADTAAPLYQTECFTTVAQAFGLEASRGWDALDEVKQQYGKIAHIDDAVRKALLFRLTHEFNIYSLGRFATWRNILLDDVVQDIAVVKRLMKGGNYELRHASGSSVMPPYPEPQRG